MPQEMSAGAGAWAWENVSTGPLGFHDGCPSMVAPSVTCCGVPPPAGTTYTLVYPVRLLENAIVKPSGDQAGCVSAAIESVRRVRRDRKSTRLNSSHIRT